MRLLLLLTLSLASLGTVASAQTAQEIVQKVEAAQKAAKDFSFRLAGTTTIEDKPQKLELLIKALPSQSLARLQFLAPDALADNIVVADKTEVRNYMYLTNQIAVTPVKKAADDAGLVGVSFTELGNMGQLFDKYNVKLLSSAVQDGAKVHQLEVSDKAGKAEKALVWITEAGWRPTRLQVLDKAGKSITDLLISNYKTNTGLSAEALRLLPKDAKVIK